MLSPDQIVMKRVCYAGEAEPRGPDSRYLPGQHSLLEVSTICQTKVGVVSTRWVGSIRYVGVISWFQGGVQFLSHL